MYSVTFIDDALGVIHGSLFNPSVETEHVCISISLC